MTQRCILFIAEVLTDQAGKYPGLDEQARLHQVLLFLYVNDGFLSKYSGRRSESVKFP
jgi:hypothetical protein